MARGKAYDDNTRAQVMAALLAGQGVVQVSKEYKVPQTTIKGWLKSEQFVEVRRKKKDLLGELLGEYVRENLITLKSQSAHFRDKAWLSKQPAAELAVLHGVIADKTIRILEAAEQSDNTTQ